MKTKQLYIPIRKLFLISWILVLATVSDLWAQDMNKEVYVVSSYKPEIADADRIATLPVIPDTFSFNTPIDYSLIPSRIRSEYEPRPIQAAKMAGTPLDKLYNSYLRAGAGNYNSPLLEYQIHNLRSKDYAVGASVYHKSAHYKRDVGQFRDIPSGYGRNQVDLYGKKFYPGFNVVARAGAWNHKIRHYGLSPLLEDTLDIESDDIRQNYKAVYGEAGIHSTATDSSDLQYSLFLKGTHFSDRYENKAPHVELSASVHAPLSFFFLGLDFNLDYVNQNVERDSARQTTVQFHPYFSMQKDRWRFTLGPRIAVESNLEGQSSYFFIDGLFAYDIVPGALTGQAGVNGYLQSNNFQSLYERNPYIVPGLHTTTTRYPVVVFAGVEGKFSSKSGYRADVRFENISDAVFFVNSDTILYQNQYTVKTLDADCMRLHGETDWNPLHSLGFLLQANYYQYSVPAAEEAWHLPGFDLTFTTRYNFMEKVSARLEYYFIGQRKAEDIHNNQAIISLTPIHDANLLFDYKYNDRLGFFLNLYNLANQKYQIWNQYPVQGLNVMLGASYKF